MILHQIPVPPSNRNPQFLGESPTSPTAAGSEILHSVGIRFTLDAGQAWENRIDDVDCVAGMPFTSPESWLGNCEDHWRVMVRVDFSHFATSEDEDRRILDRYLSAFVPYMIHAMLVQLRKAIEGDQSDP